MEDSSPAWIPKTAFRRLFGALLSLLPLAGCVTEAQRDAFPRELRTRVDAFRLREPSPPTTPENAVERVDLLWDWGNAWALEGHALPVNLTLAVHSARQRRAEGSSLSPALLHEIDTYLRELALEYEDPSALGSTHFRDGRPLRAGGWTTVEQVYTAGSAAPGRGAVFLLGAHFMADQVPLQHEDPGGEGYVSVRSSRAGAVFEPLRVPWTGMHGGFKNFEPLPAFRLTGAHLEPGDTVTFVYGDRQGGSPGFRVQTLSTERLVLPLYVDPDGSGHFLSPSWSSLRVVGTPEIVGYDVFTPSVVAPEESFELTIRASDRWFNRPTTPLPELEIFLGPEKVARIPAGGDALTVLPDLRLGRPGVYRYTVRPAGGDPAARSNPIWVREDPQRRVYWGELHAHTDFAEAQGSPEELFRYGSEDARLDFLSLTEHDAWMDDREWQVLQELTRKANASGSMVAFLGYEWTSARSLGGHHNVIFRRADASRVPTQQAPTLAELYEDLAATTEADDVLVIPHAHTAGDWTMSDPDLQRLVEIYSMHGTFEWFGNLYLQNGFELGFIAASDDHRAKPGLARPTFLEGALGQRGGLAAAVAREKSAEAIFDALRGLSAYATSGERILLDADLNGLPMGTRQPMARDRRLRVRASGTAPIDRIDVIKNGEVAFSRDYLGTGSVGSAATVQVGFESSSQVFPPPRDNPRLYRFWTGTLKVDGAGVAGVDVSGVDNHYRENATPRPGEEALRFRLETRGRRDSFLVELENASPETLLVLDLKPGKEDGIGGPFERQPLASLPPAHLSLRLADLAAGRFEHALEVGAHTDRITLQLVKATGAMDQELEWRDSGAAAPGDYYYVRVTQLDGARAWSSPFWVGQAP